MGVKSLSFIAHSNTGKTTLLEQIIVKLKQRGFKVGVIKHDAHNFDIDHPGKDSYRLTTAGADTMLITSKVKLALIKKHDTSPSLEELIKTYFSDMDIVLTEGFKMSSMPKIELHRKDLNNVLLCRGAAYDSNLIAIASDEHLDVDVPVLDLNNVEDITEFVVQFLLKY
jgi:molybdopterin-guanine dinucleotide biosynthesis adapter protein